MYFPIYSYFEFFNPMKCEICRTSYKKIESLLVCENGHTLENTTEVALEDGARTGKSKRIFRRKNQKVKYKSEECRLMRMVLIKLLFDEARAFLGIKESVVFKYFTEFFEFRNAKLSSTFKTSKATLAVLLYMAKRAEMEKNGEIYLLQDFSKEYKAFDLLGRLIRIKTKFPSMEQEVQNFCLKTNFNSTVCSFKSWIDDLTSLYIYIRPYTFTKFSETGILEECTETAKYNLRRLFRNDLEIMKAYFQAVCRNLSQKLTPDLEMHFEKFIYTYDPNTVIFPEYDFTFFIMSYLASKGSFAGSEMESTIIDYLGISKETLAAMHMGFVEKLDQLATPECYISTIDNKNKDRFTSLKAAIAFINAYKRYVAEDMIKSEIENNQPTD